MKLRLYATAIAMSLCGCAAQAAESFWAKPNITFAILAADQDECLKAARGYKPTDEEVAAAMGGNPLNASLVTGLVAQRQAAEAVQGLVQARCMRQAGYVIARLTPKEQTAYGMLLDGSPRAIWIDAFLRSDRVVEATRPLVPKLPTPATTAGFAIIPGSVSLVDGPRRIGDIVLTAGATVATAQLKDAVTYKGDRPLREAFVYDGDAVSFGAGDTFLRLPVAEGHAPPDLGQVAWCARATVAGAKTVRQVVCLVDGNDGYYVLQLAKRNLTSGVVDLPFNGFVQTGLLLAPVDLTVAETASAPVDVRYELQTSGRNAVVLTGLADIDGVTYATSIPISPNREGVIDVKAGGQTVRLTPDGTGAGRTYTARMVEGLAP